MVPNQSLSVLCFCLKSSQVTTTCEIHPFVLPLASVLPGSASEARQTEWKCCYLKVHIILWQTAPRLFIESLHSFTVTRGHI